MDSTMFMSNIKKAGRIALAFDVLERAVKSVPEDILTPNLKEVLKPEFKTDIIYRAKPSENESKLDMLLNLCFDIKNIIEEKAPEIKDPDTLRILTRFISEQSVFDEQKNKLKAKDNKNIPTNSLQSAYDEDATYRKKGEKAQSGYTLTITETCSKNNPFQMITDYKTDQNIKSDAEVGQERIPVIKENTDCKHLYFDGGYYCPEVIEKGKENEIELHFTNLNGKKPQKTLSITQFEIDESTNIITKCPEGMAPIHTGITKGQTVAHFALNICDACKHRQDCYCKKQKKDYVVRINLKAIETARQRQKIEECRKENTSMRAAIEGTNSALKRGHQLGKLKVRGFVKCNMVVGFKVLAHNFKRFANYMIEQTKKLMPQDTGISLPILSQ
ncbi:MAG: transposase [Tepidanaerobacteraceae bacterium]|jgi:hypothetical protein|nr:transposase [Tepidanaerobacteraceae bacterium]